MLRYILVLIVAVASTSATPGGRIVGGQLADIKEIPYQTSFQSFGRHFCGGTFISRDWILTAAHCFDYIRFPYPWITARVGSSDRNNGGAVIELQTIVRHPNYSRRTIDYDFTLVQLKTPVPENVPFRAATLPEQDEDLSDDTKLLVSGYGATQNREESENYLRSADVFKVNQDRCARAYGRMFTVTPRMLCAGHWGGGKDACSGDSGGPLMEGNKIVGVVSLGYGCAMPNYPGIYARTSFVRSWIRANTGV